MKNIQYFLKRNSSLIMSITSVAGIIATTVLAVKATPKAMELLKKAENQKGEQLTTLEKVKYGWKPYIYTGISGLATIGCIVGMNNVNKHRQASMASAYTLLQNTYSQYRNNIVKMCGNEVDSSALKEIVQAKYNPEIDIPDEDGDSQLFFDYYSCRYFTSTIHHVLRAECEAMELLNSQGYLILNQWYDLLGIPRVDYGYTIGWEDVERCDPYNVESLEFKLEDCTVGNGLVKCTIITSNVPPTFDYIYGY